MKDASKYPSTKKNRPSLKEGDKNSNFKNNDISNCFVPDLRNR